MALQLSEMDRARLAGDHGEGLALAMRVLVRVAEAMGAESLLDVTSAHVDGCLYHGRAGLDFVRALLRDGAEVVVPTTLNVGSLDLLHPDLVHLDDEVRAGARELMDSYMALGCRPTWTCAPYQSRVRPSLGDQIAWAESNAIVFANSVLGARTERYGDFLDICAAVTGRAPAVGLHLDEGRKATLVVSFDEVAELFADEATYALAGYVLGRVAGTGVAALTGLPATTGEDHLKALGAAAASSGAVAMFHAVGLTPEAPDLARATGGRAVPRVWVDAGMLEEAHRNLVTTSAGRIDAVSLGTPHYSVTEMRRLGEMLSGKRCRVPLFVSTSREVLGALDSSEVESLEEAGVQVVADTCTYITPILDPSTRMVMTDSVKWAYYAPTNLGVAVAFGSMAACVEAALAGETTSPW